METRVRVERLEKSIAIVWFERADLRGDLLERMCCWWIEALLINVWSSVEVRSAIERRCREEVLVDRQRRAGVRRRRGGMVGDIEDEQCHKEDSEVCQGERR